MCAAEIQGCGAQLDTEAMIAAKMSQRAMTTNATTDVPRFVALMNPKSGRQLRGSEAIRRVEALCKDRALLRHVTDDASIWAQVNQLPNRPDLEVGILGGDGTHMRVMSALLKARKPERLPVLVSVPFGTVSTISHRWGAGHSPWRILSTWLSRTPMVLRRQPTLSVVVDEHEELCGCTVGTGLVAQFFDQYESTGGGARTAVGIAARSFFSSLVSGPYSRRVMKPTRCRIATEGTAIGPTQFSLVVCSVFKDVGLGIKVTYRAGSESDCVALVTSSLPAGKLGPQFWRVLTGRPLRDPQGVDRMVRDWSLQFDERGPVIIDGDPFNVHSLHVRPGPTWSVLTPIS